MLTIARTVIEMWLGNLWTRVLMSTQYATQKSVCCV